MIILDNSGLEGLVERAIALDCLVKMSKDTPITFYNGIVEVRGAKYGAEGCDYTTDLFTAALRGVARLPDNLT